MKTYTAPQLLDKINAYLEQMPYMRPPKGLYEPIAYELSLGGKRIRPVLMLMAYNIYKEDVERILPQACRPGRPDPPGSRHSRRQVRQGSQPAQSATF